MSNGDLLDVRVWSPNGNQWRIDAVDATRVHVDTGACRFWMAASAFRRMVEDGIVTPAPHGVRA